VEWSGNGSYGGVTVWLSQHVPSGQLVAIKSVDFDKCELSYSLVQVGLVITLIEEVFQWIFIKTDDDRMISIAVLLRYMRKMLKTSEYINISFN